MRAMMFAAGPDFVQEVGAGAIGGGVQVVLQAALFLTGRGHQSAEFGFEKQVLAFAGAEDNDERDCPFGKLGGFGTG